MLRIDGAELLDLRVAVGGAGLHRVHRHEPLDRREVQPGILEASSSAASRLPYSCSAAPPSAGPSTTAWSTPICRAWTHFGPERGLEAHRELHSAVSPHVARSKGTAKARLRCSLPRR